MKQDQVKLITVRFLCLLIAYLNLENLLTEITFDAFHFNIALRNGISNIQNKKIFGMDIP